MASDFEPELERGKEKIADLEKKAESDRLESDAAAEAEKQKVFHYYGLDDFPTLKAWPADLDDVERVLLKRFVSHLKKKLPKAVPYLTEFHSDFRDIDEACLSENSRTPIGQYLYTDFRVSALVCIPSFSSIQVKWDGRFNREVALDAQEINVHLLYSFEKCFDEARIIHWEDETDWDITLVKAREQYDPVEEVRAKGPVEYPPSFTEPE